MLSPSDLTRTEQSLLFDLARHPAIARPDGFRHPDHRKALPAHPIATLIGKGLASPGLEIRLTDYGREMLQRVRLYHRNTRRGQLRTAAASPLPSQPGCSRVARQTGDEIGNTRFRERERVALALARGSGEGAAP